MATVEQAKRELCKHAFLQIQKYLAVAGKDGQESFDFRRNVRKKDALNIDLATNKEVMQELTKFRESGEAAMLASGALQVLPAYGPGAAKGAAVPAAGGPSKAGMKGPGGGSGGGGVGAPHPPLGPMKAAAKPSKSAAKPGGKADGGPSPSLPPRIGAKVNRWWPNEGQWYTCVVTDFNTETKEYRLTYNLGSAQETYEDFNLDAADPSVFELTGEKVNLLAKTGSAAVNNSVVLQPFLARSGAAGGGGGGGGASGGGGGGGGGGSKSKKRRNSSDSDDDSD